MPRLILLVPLVAGLSACFVDPADDAGATSTASTTATSSATSSTAVTTTDSSPATATGTATGTTTGTATGTATDAGEMCGDPVLAMTPTCVLGSDITSVADGDALCERTFGAGWRWLEHHIQGGWSVNGTWLDEVGIGERGWIHLDNQNTECFSSPGVDDGRGGQIFHGVTWRRSEEACGAGCSPGDGLEGPEFQPHSGQCNSYTGDTPCSLCRRVICVS